MANMIPDSCPSKATSGEKRLFRLFQEILPDNYSVWYEPVVQGRYPDFTILADTFGLLLLEEKAWKIFQIGEATDNLVDIRRDEDEHIERMANPIRQVREYTCILVDQLKQQPILRNATGDYEGNLSFPLSRGLTVCCLPRSNDVTWKSADLIRSSPRVR